MSEGNGDSKQACSLTLSLSFLITAVRQGDLSRSRFWKPHSFCTWSPFQRAWACLCCLSTAARTEEPRGLRTSHPVSFILCGICFGLMKLPGTECPALDVTESLLFPWKQEQTCVSLCFGPGTLSRTILKRTPGRYYYPCILKMGKLTEQRQFEII